jgi:hypothetical protein
MGELILCMELIAKKLRNVTLYKYTVIIAFSMSHDNVLASSLAKMACKANLSMSLGALADYSDYESAGDD